MDGASLELSARLRNLSGLAPREVGATYLNSVFGLYANDSVLFSKSNWRRTGSAGTSWTVPLDGELRSLSDELSAGAVGRSSRRAGQKEASSDPLVRRDLGLGRLKNTEGWP